MQREGKKTEDGDYILIDQRKLLTDFRNVLREFKETNQICLPLKIGQSINTEQSTGDRNNKGMYSCFYERKKFLGCLMQREGKKTEDGENEF